MSIPRFVVSDPEGRWTVALRWALEDARVEVRQVGGVDDAFAAANEAVAVGLVVTVENVEEICRRLDQVSHRPRPPIAVVLAGRDWAPYEPLFREAGAAHVEFTTRNLTRLARKVVHWARTPCDDRELTDRQRVRARMPWPDAAGGAEP